MKDLRFAVRALVKNPGFTFVAVITLALGIGSTTALLSVVDAVLLRPLPYPQPERIVELRELDETKTETMTKSDVRDCQARPSSFVIWSLFRTSDFGLRHFPHDR